MKDKSSKILKQFEKYYNKQKQNSLEFNLTKEEFALSIIQEDSEKILGWKPPANESEIKENRGSLT